MNHPRITLVTPSFNQGEFIEQTIASVLDQQYPNLEYAIIDGGSTDSTVSIIRKYEKHLSWWVSEPDNGMYHAINKGFKKSSGEIMGWLNADDVMMPKSLFLLSDLFSRHNHVQWVQGQPLVLSTGGYVTRHRRHEGCRYDYYLNRYRDGVHFIQQESTYWRKALWETAGGYVSTEYKLAGDFELWMRFFHHAELFHTRGHIAAFRFRQGQLSANKEGYFRECATIINKELAQLEAENRDILSRYATWLKLRNVPVVKHVAYKAMSSMLNEHIELKFIDAA